MTKRLGIITVHGMGDTPRDYADDMLDKVRKMLARDGFNLDEEVAVGSAYYQDVLQHNEEAYFKEIERKVAHRDLHKFMIYAFCDAATLESQKDDGKATGGKSPYTQAQEKLSEAFKGVYKELEPGAPLFIIAQSLGGQVMSNYLWDANPNTCQAPDAGFWKNPPPFASPEEEKFCRGFQLQRFFTTGCNIPLFVAGRHRSQIQPIEPIHTAFEWHNFYDAADILGYPLQDLSDSYWHAVTDHRIRAGFWGGILPTSHTKYWTDREFLNPLVNDMKRVLRSSV